MYGPLARIEKTVDGITYVVVRGDLYPEGRKFTLRRKGVPGPPDAHVFVRDAVTSDDAMAQAVQRLLG